MPNRNPSAKATRWAKRWSVNRIARSDGTLSVGYRFYEPLCLLKHGVC
jgi:hypothetical protein